MTFQSCFRFVTMLGAGVLLAACGTSSPEPPTYRASASPVTPSNTCRWNPRACIYEGSYERGERDYAEEEARRLNQAALRRMRRW